MGNKGAWIVAGALLLALPFFLIYYSGGVSLGTADFRGQVEEKERVRADGDFIVAQKREFFQLCSAIQTQGQNLKVQEDLRDSATDPESKEEYALNAAAIESQRNENVNEYNAKAANEDVGGVFRDSELPKEIDPSDRSVECGTV